MKININGAYREMTPQEEAEYFASIADLAQDYENGEISTEDALKKLFHLLGTKLTLTDEEAVENSYLYDEYKVGILMKPLYRFRYNGKLYEVKEGQEHTSATQWRPNEAHSLYRRVAEDNEEGTLESPIAFELGMKIYNGKYYSENGVVYYCNRDSGNELYNPLSSLVQIYVVVAE